MVMQEIPISPGFYISPDGKVVMDGEGKRRNFYRNGDGYVTTAVKVNGVWVTLGVHRLVLLTYKPRDDAEDLVANHLDLDKSNNDISNLEWLTVEMNNVHASVFESNPVTDRVVGVKDDTKIHYRNVQAVSIVTKVPASVVWSSIRDGLPLDGWRFYHNHRSKLSGVLPNKPNFNHRDDSGRAKSRGVKAKSFITSEINTYPTITACAKALGVVPSAITQLLQSSTVRLLSGEYAVVDVDADFPAGSEVEGLIGSCGGISKEVLTYHPDLGWEIYPSASSFVRLRGLSRKGVTTRLKRNKVSEYCNWVFGYMNDTNSKLMRDLVMKSSSDES